MPGDVASSLFKYNPWGQEESLGKKEGGWKVKVFAVVANILADLVRDRSFRHLPPETQPEVRQATLRVLLTQHKVVVGAFLEVRGRKEILTETKGHLVYASAATGGGSNRCQILLSKTVPYAQKGVRGLFSSAHQVAKVHSEPTILAIAVSVPALKFNIIAAQAPHHCRPLDVRSSWWTKLQNIALGKFTNCRPFLLFIDANASIGLETSDCIGGLDASKECPSGALFHSILRNTGMCVPLMFMNQGGYKHPAMV